MVLIYVCKNSKFNTLGRGGGEWAPIPPTWIRPSHDLLELIPLEFTGLTNCKVMCTE